MSIRLKPTQMIAGLAAGALLAGGGYAFAASQTKTIHGCVGNRSHALLVEKRCPKGYRSLVWDQRGPTGAKGARGARGARGERGATGKSGAGAAVSVGTVTTGTTAAVTNTGSAANAVLNFTLPESTQDVITAYGQVWPGASGTTIPMPVLKNGNSNVVAVVSGEAAGAYGVVVKGCSASGEVEPVINVSANVDPNDPNFTQAPVLAEADGWQTDTTGQYVGDLSITFSTVNSTTGNSVDADFAFTVYC